MLQYKGARLSGLNRLGVLRGQVKSDRLVIGDEDGQLQKATHRLPLAPSHLQESLVMEHTGGVPGARHEVQPVPRGGGGRPPQPRVPQGVVFVVVSSG